MMTRPIEAIIEEAQQRLEVSGRLDIDTYATVYPDHAAELRRLLPVLVQLYEEKRWAAAEERANAFAMNSVQKRLQRMTAMAAVPAPPAEDTVGELFRRIHATGDLSEESHGETTGLPAEAIHQLIRDKTPLSKLDLPTIKRLAISLSVSFAALAKEIGRLTGVEGLAGGSAQEVFTRDQKESTDEERQALIRKIQQSGRGPRPKDDAEKKI